MDSLPAFASLAFILVVGGLLGLATIEGLFESDLPIPRSILLRIIVALSVIALPLKEQLGYANYLIRKLLLSASQFLQPEKNKAESPSELHAYSSGANTVEVIPLRLQGCHPAEWDIFARQCDASFRSTRNWLQGWSIKL